MPVKRLEWSPGRAFSWTLESELASRRVSILLLATLIALLQLESSLGSGSQPQRWERPGCHRVGHYREISIDGCLKFNISTNACRGRCISFSVPAIANLDLLSDYQQASSAVLLDAGTQNDSSPSSIAASEQPRELEEPTKSQQEQQAAGQLDELDKEAQKQSPFQQLFQTEASQSSSLQQQQQQLPSGGSPLVGTSGSGEPARRDVVSVSQCCNMMESEDVIVNVRCTGNEIRRLVFKSAKSCECFFCKHL